MAAELKTAIIVLMEKQLIIFLIFHETCGDRCNKHSITTSSLLWHGFERPHINCKRGLTPKLKTVVAWPTMSQTHHIQHRVHIQLGQSGYLRHFYLNSAAKISCDG